MFLSVFICLSIAIVSCEKDFTDIGSNVISNTKFDTNIDSVYVTAVNSPLERLQSDNISRQLAQYLLGVYANADYEKLEASIVSQVSIPSGLQVIDDANIYDADTTIVTTIDAVYLKLPYQVSLETNATQFEIDSVIGDVTKPFNLNIYRSDTYINALNPSDPTKVNSFFSDDVFEKNGGVLNSQADFPFIPSENDTMLVISRKLFDDTIYQNDTIKYFGSVTSTIPLPFARIPLNQDTFKELFLDKYDDVEFASQAAFNDYFRGVILEATGTEGSLVSFNFNNTTASLNPSIEVYYTNTVLKSGTTVLDTISKNDSFPLAGFRVNTFKMDERVYPTNNEIKIQGTAGSEGNITLLTPDKIEELKMKDWLINDATLTFYINQSANVDNVPERLYLYKTDEAFPNPIFSQIKDATSEASFGGISGFVQTNSEVKDSYTFKVTDYISDILNGSTAYVPTLKLKAYNPTDLPSSVSDTLFDNYSWNPKAVTIFNNLSTNGNKRPILKISYSEKK